MANETKPAAAANNVDAMVKMFNGIFTVSKRNQEAASRWNNYGDRKATKTREATPPTFASMRVGDVVLELGKTRNYITVTIAKECDLTKPNAEGKQDRIPSTMRIVAKFPSRSGPGDSFVPMIGAERGDDEARNAMNAFRKLLAADWLKWSQTQKTTTKTVEGTGTLTDAAYTLSEEEIAALGI